MDAMIDLIPDAVYAKGLDGRHILVNTATARASGRSVEEAVGKNDAELFDADWARKFAETDRRVVAEGAAITFELTVSSAQSMRTYLTTKGPFRNGHGRVIGVLGFSRDVTEQRQTEHAHEDSRRRFQAIFENALDGVLLIDDAGRYVDANPASLLLLGCSREELLQLTIWDVTPGVDRERIPDLMREFLSAGTMSGEYTFLRRDGSIREVEYRSVANILPGLHLGIHRDITERKRAEHELQNRHNLLHAVIESIPDAVYVKDREGRTLLLNSHGARRIGKTVAELIGCDNSVFFSPETAQHIRVVDRQVIESGQSMTLEEVFTAAGVTRTLLTSKAPFRNAGGEVIGLLGISRDITESKALQAERDRLLERLRLQIDRLPLAYMLLDEHYRVIDWNPAAETMFGYTKAEALGQRALDLIVPQPPSAELVELIRRVVSGDMHADNVNENRTKDGRIITCHWFNTPLMDPDGNFAGVISVAQDVTDRMRADQALRSSAARLRDLSRRVVEIQEQERRHIARELHDEIGQVLSAVSINLQGLKGTSTAASSRIDESIQIVDQALQQVRNLSLELRPHMLDDLGLAATLRWLLDRQTQRSGLVPHFAVKSSGLPLPPNLATACFRVAQEALTNVVRHAHAHSVWVELEQSDEELRLLVRDDGDGFDVETARRRGRVGESFGLLAIQERVELLGGFVRVESQPGHGASIHIRFPLRSTAAADDPSEEGH